MATGRRLQGVDVRSAVPSDAADIAGLLGQVGEAVTARAVAVRLEGLSRDSAVLVATGFAPAIGVVALHWSRGLASEAGIARIDVLVVNEEDRGRGIGRMLLKSASQLARMAGCDVLEVVAARHEGRGSSFLAATGFVGCGELMCRALRRRSSLGE